MGKGRVMELAMTEKGDVKLLHFIGKISSTGSVQMADMIAAFSKSEYKKIVIDFTKTSFIDTVGISKLVESCKKIQNSEKELAIVAEGAIRQLFFDIYFNRLFEIADSLDKALQGNSSTPIAPAPRVK
ncbi:MAG: STAS domain-containing protein [Chitinivibrionales bacterium]|nr:STAS domain-containing protein [Chitinivibrionales bacterium]